MRIFALLFESPCSSVERIRLHIPLFWGGNFMDFQALRKSLMKSIRLVTPERSSLAGWFPGASREAVADAVRAAAQLPATAAFHLETANGIVVALDDSIPDGTELQVVVDQPPGIAPAPKVEVIPVPGPKGYPLIGNLPDLRHPDGPMAAVKALHMEYGDFISIHAGGKRLYFCANADIVTEIRDQPEIFPKLVEGKNGLANLSEKSTGRGLFTSSDTDPMWHQAHRILMPAFSASALKNYYGRILDVADDLFTYLDSLGPDESFLATDIMTQMTFEAIAFAAFNKKYDSIGKPELPPFVAAMNVVLHDAMEEPHRMLPEVFYRDVRKARADADKLMTEEVDGIIRERRAAMARGEAVPTDLLQIMITTPDRVTGLNLPDDNIRGQLITFLIAGHETTSGLLSYTLYHLWKNPVVQEKLIAEADAVLGRDYSYQCTYEDCARLEYTHRVLKEALRLNPTAPMFTRAIVRDTTLGNGRYKVLAGERLFVSLNTLHTHPDYWGEAAHDFNPDNFLPEAEAARHPDAFHPFGMGMRACIGFQFAFLEAKMVLARFAQRYLARATNPDYVLRDKQALTVKPDHLEMILTHRPEKKGRFPVHPEQPKTPEPVAPIEGHRPMSVLYGSNMGTSRELALSLAQEANKRGFSATVAELDDQVDRPWLKEGPVIIITSTYNGIPPDNAARFAAYLEKSAPKTCEGVRYAVLGCGNKQWKLTFQKFPQTLQARLRELGGEPFAEPGAADADGDFESAVEAWKAALWKGLAATFAGAAKTEEPDDSAPTVTVEVVNFAGASADAAPPDRTKLDQDSVLSVIRVNRELQAAGSVGSTRHIEIPLPASATYSAGDHLGVFPQNPPAIVEAVAARCGVAPSTVVLLTRNLPEVDGSSGLPVGRPISVNDLFAEHVDLTGPVTRRELRAWAKTADCPPDKVKLDQWLADFPKWIGEGKPSLLSLLEKVPSVRMDLATLLTLRPPLKPRYYSISSSPRLSADSCSLTVGVHHFKTNDGLKHDGLCSNYLARCAENAPVRIVVKDTGSSFRLPQEISAPVILVGPGTGLAPMRGFLQERHALRQEGAAVGKTFLFFGCRGDEDYIYREELETYLKEGTLDLLEVAFSRRLDRPKTYVQDLIKLRAVEVAELFKSGGSILVCGNARGMAPSVRQAFVESFGLEEIEKFERENRYLQDVWASG